VTDRGLSSDSLEGYRSKAVHPPPPSLSLIRVSRGGAARPKGPKQQRSLDILHIDCSVCDGEAREIYCGGKVNTGFVSVKMQLTHRAAASQRSSCRNFFFFSLTSSAPARSLYRTGVEQVVEAAMPKVIYVGGYTRSTLEYFNTTAQTLLFSFSKHLHTRFLLSLLLNSALWTSSSTSPPSPPPLH